LKIKTTFRIKVWLLRCLESSAFAQTITLPHLYRREEKSQPDIASGIFRWVGSIFVFDDVLGAVLAANDDRILRRALTCRLFDGAGACGDAPKSQRRTISPAGIKEA
jgi:hypothetical protein